MRHEGLTPSTRGCSSRGSSAITGLASARTEPVHCTHHNEIWRLTMYAITGITGNVGSELARTLLAAGQRVRGIVRDAKKGEEWAARGCSIALATMEDTAALTSAF